jgi:cytochrome c oxidase subunit 2
LPHTKKDLKNWIKNPETYKPGNKMTGKYTQMTDAQLDALAEYLMGLKVQQ